MSNQYKWESPHDWLDQYLAGLGPGELLTEAKNLARKLDGDELQDLYQSNMQAQGYFRKLGACEDCDHADWQHAREGDPRLESEDYEIGQCYVKGCDCAEYSEVE